MITLVQVLLSTVQELHRLSDDATVSIAKRSLAVRRFCNKYKASAPGSGLAPADPSLWASVDTDHLLTISSNMALLSDYLTMRVVAAS